MTGKTTRVVLRVNDQFVESDSIEEVTTLPGYVPEYELKPDEPVHPIGYYYANPWVHCGLCAGHQLHERGWVFGSTKGTTRFNVGHDCARDHLGIDFETDTRLWKDGYRRFSNRRVIAAFQDEKLQHVLGHVEDLRSRPHGVAWAIETLRRLMNEDLPVAVLRKIDEISKSQDPRIYIDRIANDTERALEEDRRKKPLKGPWYVRQPVGVVDGAEVLHEDLRKLVEINLRDYLVYLTTFDANIAEELDLERMTKFVRSVDDRLQKAERGLQAAQRFLTQKNLLQFAHAKLSSEEVAQLRRAIVDLPAGDSQAA